MRKLIQGGTVVNASEASVADVPEPPADERLGVELGQAGTCSLSGTLAGSSSGGVGTGSSRGMTTISRSVSGRPISIA